MHTLLRYIRSWFRPPPAAPVVGNDACHLRLRGALLLYTTDPADAGLVIPGHAVSQLVSGALPASTEEG